MVECMVMSKSKEYEYNDTLHQPLHTLMSESEEYPDPDVKSKLGGKVYKLLKLCFILVCLQWSF